MKPLALISNKLDTRLLFNNLKSGRFGFLYTATSRSNQHLRASHFQYESGETKFKLGSCLTVGVVSSVLLAAVYMHQKRNGLVVNAASPVRPEGDDSKGLGLRNKFNFVADAVEKVSPAVVFIETSSMYQGTGTGSGFIISPDGLIVTNAHVVQSARDNKVEIQLQNGIQYIGVVQVLDSKSDLALVKINATNLPTVTLGKSAILRPGEWVAAVGSPLSLSNTVTSGIVSSTARAGSELGLDNNIDYIQTDAPITFGNSGGPLINLDGEAVGVNSMKVTDGISFAIPSDYVKEFLIKADDFKKLKEAKRKSKPAYLGIKSMTLSPRVLVQLRNRIDIGKLDVNHGVFVVEVDADSPAKMAGIQAFDVILKIDDKPIRVFNDMLNAIKDKREIKCKIYRNGDIKDIFLQPRFLDAQVYI